MEKQRGTVKWFSREKGWGFIRLDSGDEIFVHHSDIEGEGFVNLEDDEPVEFTVEEMEKGPRARNVRSLADGRTSEPRRGDRPGEPRRGAEPSPGAESRPSEGPGQLRPLAEQLRERLGRRFPGMSD